MVQPKGGLGVGVTGVAGEAGATGQGLEGGQAVPPVQDTICANASATAVAMAVSTFTTTSWEMSNADWPPAEHTLAKAEAQA